MNLELKDNGLDNPFEFYVLKLMGSIKCLNIPIYNFTNQVMVKD